MFSLVSQAWRSWRSAGPVGLLAVVAFTVGIGSTTAIYTVVHGLLLKPVPYARGDRFVSLLGARLGDPSGMSGLTVADALEYQQRMRSFDVFGWFKFANYNLTFPGEPLLLNGLEVTPALVNSLGVNPRLGQWFPDAAAPAAVIAHGLWQRLGADPHIVGKAITLNKRIYTVAGVMPRGFGLPVEAPYGNSNVDVWLALDPTGRGQPRDQGILFAYGRLRAGVTLAAAQAEARRVAADIARQEPASHHAYTARVDNLLALITRDVRPILLLLFAAAGLLLVITCANVGGLLVARSIARARETAVRVALGAGLRQLAREYFVEGFFVALPGAAGGLLFSAAVIRVLLSFVGQASVRVQEIAIDWRAGVFAVATALLAAALTTMAPLWQAARTLPNEVLNDGVRASAGVRSRWLSQSLVVAEIALAFVLLSAGALLVNELRQIMRVWPGFDPDHLLTFQMTDSEGSQGPKLIAYQTRLIEAIRAVPGVSGADIVNQLPPDCCFSTAIFPEGASANPSTGERVSFVPVSPGYWHTMRIPLRRGRFLDQHDLNEKMMPVVINQATVARYWPDKDPVGAFGHFSHPKGDRFQVVGVIGDVKNNGLDSPTVPEIYLPAAIVPVEPMHFVVRSPLPENTLVPAIRRAIAAVNPGQPLFGVAAMRDVLSESLALKRAASTVMTFFALAALLMATLGTYGLVSYSVRQRTVEIGTRMALGAGGRELLCGIVGSGLKMAAWGIAIGGVASVGVCWLLVHYSQLQHLGWLPFAFSAALVAAMAMVSSLFPAFRAMLLSPMVAIRNEPGSMWESARPGVRRLFEALSRSVSGRQEPPEPLQAALIEDFIEASRRAGSFRDALRAVMESLRGSTGAQSALLLESVSDTEYRLTAAVPNGSLPSCSIPARGLLAGRLRSLTAPLALTGADLDAWQRWAAGYKPQYTGEIETLRAIGARLALPLRTNKNLVGVLLFAPPAGRDTFQRDEKHALHGCADLFALMLENARLTDRVVQQEMLRRDIALAAEVQKRLLPRQSLETPGARIAAVNLPARTVGGDYYDFLELDGARTGIALADVAGKGVAAALIMSVVQASLRVIATERGIALPQLVAKMNAFLYRSTGSSSYATFFYAQFHDGDRRLSYVNAGHNPPYLLRAGNSALEELAAGGTIIGMFPCTAYEEASVALGADDLLFAFTDGVTEALNPAGVEFGEERLRDLLRRVHHLEADEMSAQIANELKGWMADAPRHDDLTFVLMKVK